MASELRTLLQGVIDAYVEAAATARSSLLQRALNSSTVASLRHSMLNLASGFGQDTPAQPSTAAPFQEAPALPATSAPTLEGSLVAADSVGGHSSPLDALTVEQLPGVGLAVAEALEQQVRVH
jgi:hypothetical protein